MKVTRAVAMAREQAAWELRQQGYRQTSIAEKLGIDPRTVSDALQRIEKRVLAEMHTEAAQYKARVTAALWTQYEDLRKLYEASKGPKREQRIRRAGGLRQQGRPEGGDVELVESKVEERIGDVAIFREMRATLETVLKIWGGYAPTKVAPTSPDGERPYTPEEPLTADERARRIKALLASLAPADQVAAQTTRRQTTKAKGRG